MDQTLVTQMSVSVVTAIAAATACVASGSGFLVGLGAYCLVGSLTLVTLAVARAYAPLTLRAGGRAAAEAAEKKSRAYA